MVVEGDEEGGEGEVGEVRRKRVGTLRWVGALGRPGRVEVEVERLRGRMAGRRTRLMRRTEHEGMVARR